MQKPAILIISSEFPPGPGGIGNHAYQLAGNLHRLGWQVSVLSPQNYAQESEVEQFNCAQPFRVARVRSGQGIVKSALTRLSQTYRLGKSFRPDVLLGTGFSGVVLAAQASMLLKLPFAAVAHGTEFRVRKNIAGVIKRWAFRRANAVVAVSQFTVGVMASAGIKARRVEVITNAADSLRFFPLNESECGSFRHKTGFEKASLLLTVGCVSERKGQDVLIRALPLVLQKVPDAHYVMVGLPALQEKLTSLAKRMAVAERVHFWGKVNAEELVRWLNCCDLFVMTSRTTATGDCEGFGIAVVEAALCGKPAVVSENSGLVEAIQNGVTGLAVPEGDESATAEAIIKLLQDPSRRQAMGEAARARALREQTWETCGGHYDRILRQIIGNPGMRPDIMRTFA